LPAINGVISKIGKTFIPTGLLFYTSMRLKLHHPGSRAATAPDGFKIFDDENIKAG